MALPGFLMLFVPFETLLSPGTSGPSGPAYPSRTKSKRSSRSRGAYRIGQEQGPEWLEEWLLPVIGHFFLCQIVTDEQHLKECMNIADQTRSLRAEVA